MKENQKKLIATLEMFKPFLEGNNLSTEMSDYLETVYYVPREKMSFYNGITNTSNLFDKTKIFPVSADNTKGYFVAEFWFPYLTGGIIKSNYFMISHVFKLDIKQIETELNKIADADGRIPGLLEPQKIACILQEHFKEKHSFFLNENGKEYYKILAEILYKGWIGITFGI
jgi:hypothetical protein